MERVRRVISQGGYNYISVVGQNLAVSAEKKTILAFDSLHPAEDLDMMEAEVKDNCRPLFESIIWSISGFESVNSEWIRSYRIVADTGNRLKD